MEWIKVKVSKSRGAFVMLTKKKEHVTKLKARIFLMSNSVVKLLHVLYYRLETWETTKTWVNSIPIYLWRLMENLEDTTDRESN